MSRRWYAGILLTIALFAGCSSPPSDGQLIAKFETQRASLEQLRAMLVEDSQFRMVRKDWTLMLSGHIEYAGGPHPSITDARWNAYRSKFRELRLTGGVTRATDGHCIYFESCCDGLLFAPANKGIAYCERTPARIVMDLDKEPIHGNGETFRSIEGNWYVFFESH